jgi:hypothetical protein
MHQMLQMLPCASKMLGIDEEQLFRLGHADDDRTDCSGLLGDKSLRPLPRTSSSRIVAGQPESRWTQPLMPLQRPPLEPSLELQPVSTSLFRVYARVVLGQALLSVSKDDNCACRGLDFRRGL